MKTRLGVTGWLVKQSNPTANPRPIDQQTNLEKSDNDRYTHQALKVMLQNTALGGLVGTGAGLGFQGLRWLMRPELGAGSEEGVAPVRIPIPVQPNKLPEKKKRRPLLPFSKTGSVGDSWDKAVNFVRGKPQDSTPASSSSGSGASSDFVGAVTEMAKRQPLLLSANVLGPAFGAYLGWRGMNSVGDYVRKNEQESELEKEKKKFERSLLEQYPDSKSYKLASVQERKQHTHALLEKLYDVCTERGGMTKQAFLDTLLGGYTAYAGIAGPLAAYLAYNRHKEDKDKIMEAALKRRAVARALESPPELRLVPVPVEHPEEVKARKKEKNAPKTDETMPASTDLSA